MTLNYSKLIRLSKADNKEFYNSKEWRDLRALVLARSDHTCVLCGFSSRKGMVVDHIKPRKVYPQFAFDFNNLRCVCNSCHSGLSSSLGRGGDHKHGVIKKPTGEDGFPIGEDWS